MEKDKPSYSEIRQYLKDAGSYESTMSINEMYELHEVLKLSRNSYPPEDDDLKILEKTGANCSMLDDLKANSIIVDQTNGSGSPPEASDVDDEGEQNKLKDCAMASHTSSSNETVLDITEDASGIMDVFNSVPTTHKPLNKLNITPIYKAPIYCRAEVLQLSYTERVALISEYHSNLLKQLSLCQKRSIHFAPWGKPIQPSANFNGSLDRKLEESPTKGVHDISQDSGDLRSLRSGRQTKRTLYAQYNDVNEREHNNEPITISQLSSTLKRNEAVKRSKLDIPSSSRAERMFDSIVENDIKIIKKEEEVEKFKNSLIEVTESGNEEEDISSPEFIRRRIVPPPFQSGTRKRALCDGHGGTRTLRSNKTLERKSGTDSTGYGPLENTTITVNNKKHKMCACPICNENFFQWEIEEHAGSCSLPMDVI